MNLFPKPLFSGVASKSRGSKGFYVKEDEVENFLYISSPWINAFIFCTSSISNYVIPNVSILTYSFMQVITSSTFAYFFYITKLFSDTSDNKSNIFLSTSPFELCITKFLHD